MINSEFIKKFPVEELISLENNPRIFTEDSKRKIRSSIKRDPELLSVNRIIIDEEKNVIVGNLRTEVLKEDGVKFVPVEMIKNISKEQKERLVIISNSHAGEWDMTKVSYFLEEEAHYDFFDFPPVEEEAFEEYEEIEAGNYDSKGNKIKEKKEGSEGSSMVSLFLTKEQLTLFNNKIQDAKKKEEFKYYETFGNENQQSNALCFILSDFE